MLAAGLGLLLAACAGPVPDFSLSLSNSTVAIEQGDSLTVTVTVTGSGGFDGVVDLSYGVTTAQDPDITVDFADTSTKTSTTMTITVGDNVDADSDYTLTVTGVSGSISRGATLTIDVTEPPPPGGTLVVAVSGLPAGVDADVTVTGPGGFSQDLTATTVLPNLVPGSYQASAGVVTTGNDSYSPTVSGSPGQVSGSTGAVITVDYQLNSGSLKVTVNGLPAGVAADVTVTGAKGFSQTVTATSTLTGLEPGIYVLSASPVETADPIVIEVYAFETSLNVEVQSNTTVERVIDYAVQPGTGRLWMPDSGSLTGTIAGYSSGQLAAGGSPAPATTLSGLSNPEALAFDGQGNMWVAEAGAHTIQKFEATDLASDRSPAAKVTITGDDDDDPWGIAFDSAGNLWVANHGYDTLTKYRPDQLVSSGNPTPDVTLSSDGASLNRPVGLAFDADGNLWVTNDFGDTIERFTPAQLAQSGKPTPDVVLTPDVTADLDGPYGLAFDGDGNLWVANAVSDTVIKYRSDQLVSSGSPTPDVTLSSNAGSLDAPRGIAIDHDGGLWVVSSLVGSGSLVRFAPTQLGVSGNPVPDVTLAISIVDPAPVAFPAFSPTPSNLPINTP